MFFIKYFFALSFFLLCVLLLPLALIVAQTPFSTLPNWQYGIAEGLNSSMVYDAVQAHEGFMWFATKNGVYIYLEKFSRLMHNILTNSF